MTSTPKSSSEKEIQASAQALLSDATVQGGVEDLPTQIGISQKGDPTVKAIPLKGDNQSSIALAHNPVFRSRTKTHRHPASLYSR